MSKPTITINWSGIGRDGDSVDWYAEINAYVDASKEGQFSGSVHYVGPTRDTKAAAKKDAKRLREWWKERPKP